MAQRKGFPLRLEPAVYDALQRWADTEMRSMNAQIEFLLRGALRQAGRLPRTQEPLKEDVGNQDVDNDTSTKK
jgi:hypothetical protein